MASKFEDNYIVERFTLDDSEFNSYAELITKAFLADEAAQTDGASIVFTEQTFRTIFGAPSINRELFVRAIHKPTNEVVGFLGSITKNLTINGEIYKTAIPSWLAVKKEHQRNGIAKSLGKKMFESAREMGYEGGFAFHEPEQRGIDTSTAVARDLNIPLQNLSFMTQFVIRVFDPTATVKVIKVKWYEKLLKK